MLRTPRKKNRPLLGFYVLVAYVVVQFCWWSYLLFSLDTEIYHLKTELNMFKSSGPAETTRLGNDLESKLHIRRAMITGEGTVFFVLLISGIFVTRSSFRKEHALNKQQKNFILSITHELRSPLASARLQMETLAVRELDKPKQQQIIQGAMSDIDRLNALVENILLAARIDDSSFRLHKENTDLSEVIESLMEKFRSQHPGRNIEVRSQKGITADIDRFSFPSILLNLCENALKYSDPGTLVLVNLSRDKQLIRLSVTDEGIGISETDKSLIFKKFYRAGNEETRSTRGTGLGLYIASYLSELHGGTLTVKNNLPKGTIFEFVLPTAL
ncbi:MAG: sensor histidine kinase [Bacteroidia bacterium]